jgi:hypothetical protein
MLLEFLFYHFIIRLPKYNLVHFDAMGYTMSKKDSAIFASYD